MFKAKRRKLSLNKYSSSPNFKILVNLSLQIKLTHVTDTAQDSLRFHTC